jgi:hypothetical protein
MELYSGVTLQTLKVLPVTEENFESCDGGKAEARANLFPEYWKYWLCHYNMYYL